MRNVLHILFYFLTIPNYLFLQQKEVNYSTPTNISILNSEADDFAPSYNRFEDLLYFNSTISGYSQFYITRIIDSINFEPPRKLNDELNEKYRNQSYITFASKDLAYLSAYRLGSERSFLNIFQTERKKKSWIKSYIVESLVSDFFSAHPTVSLDGTTMIFSSNRNSEKDTDLWMAFKNIDGSWGNVINLSELNSSGNEITPFLFTDDSLFFASDGLGGKGGYDLFLSIKIDGVWQSPVPLTQFNTEWDESDFILLPNKTIIFASNRPGGRGGLDLYVSNPTFINKTETIAINDIELSIATQSSNINITKVTNQSLIFLPNFILVNKDLYINIDSNINDLNIATYDKILDNTLNLLLYRLLSTKSQGISLSIISNVDSIFKTKLKSYLISILTEYGNLDSTNIRFSDVNYTENNELLINLAEEKNSILIRYYLFNEINDLSIKISNDKYILEPTVIELLFDSRPRTFTEKINYNLSLNDIIIFKSDAIKSLPEQKLFDLGNYAEKVWNSDSIIINLDAFDKNNTQKSKRLVIDINKTEKGEINSTLFQNVSYNVFYFLVGSAEDINSLSFISYLKILKNKTPYFNDSINIILLCPEKNKDNMIIEKIVQILKNIYSNRININIVKDYNISDNKFLNYCYKILIKNN